MNSFERLTEALRDYGNEPKFTGHNQARAASPGHGPKDDGFAYEYDEQNGKTLVFVHNGDVAEALDLIGLEMSDLFDEPLQKESSFEWPVTAAQAFGIVEKKAAPQPETAQYRYPDGRVVHRSVADGKKKFTQSGNTQGRALFGSDQLGDSELVLVVEGEKDVLNCRECWNLPAVTQAQGAKTNPDKADWEPLAGREVRIIADKDEAGRKRAKAVYEHLKTIRPAVKRVTIWEAAKDVEGKGADLTDHIQAGYGPAELVHTPVRKSGRRVISTLASKVKPKKINWLIDQWLPDSEVTLLSGREGLGKSTIACRIAADATNGQLANGSPMDIAYLHTEDSREHTVVPRLRAAGANLDRVHLIDVETENGHEGALKLPEDADILAEFLKDNDIHLVVLDALKSVMGSKLDDNKEIDVREFLEPLSQIAQSQRVAFIGITHFGKRETNDAGLAMLGSVAWNAVVRSALAVARDEDGSLVVTNTKRNLARAVVSRRAVLESVPVALDDNELADIGAAKWGEFTDVSAEDLLGQKSESSEDAAERDFMQEVIADCIADNDGAATAKQVKAAVEAAGLSYKTAQNKKRKLGFTAVKQGNSWKWIDQNAEQGPDQGPDGDLAHKKAGAFGAFGAFQVRGGLFSPEKVKAPKAPTSTSVGALPGPSGALSSTVDKTTAEITLPLTLSEREQFVLDQLSCEVPTNLGKLMRSIKELTGDGTWVVDVLDELSSRGQVDQPELLGYVKTMA